MKKGCFVKLIIIITIFTAIVVYIIQYKFDELVVKPGKKFISSFAVEQVREKFSELKPSPEKDTLSLLAKDIFSDSAVSKEIPVGELHEFVQSLDRAALDSILTPAELQNLKNILNERLK